MACNFIPPVTCSDGLPGLSLTTACSGSKFLLFMSLLDTLIRSNKKISGSCKRVRSVQTPDDTYDFVVVGEPRVHMCLISMGGAGGSVVAARLSEITEWNILALEGGPVAPAGTSIPNFVGSFIKGTEMDWNYTTTNESHACLATNGSCKWPSGKNLGGNTAHNHMVYMRGNPTDFNNWAALGNKGWSWKDVKPFYLKGESNGEIDRVGRDHHGTSGPLPVEKFPYFPEFGRSLLAAAEQAGYGTSEDLNGDTITGFSIAQSACKDGVRFSSADAYLRPVRNRKNLHISLNSFVTRLIVENETVVGVEYHKDGKRRRVNVRREVILSASTVGSPHILLHSGIGPKEHLKSKKIRVVKDLPGVGCNLHDHVSTGISFTINETDIYDNNWAVAFEYLAHQTGPLSATGLSQLLGILASDETTPDFPDMEILFSGYSEICAPGKIGALRSRGRRRITILPAYLHPASKGRISLASNDPFENPVIWSNYLGNECDVRRLVKGIRMVFKLANTPALRAHDFTIADAPLEACSDYKFMSDEYWACFVRQITVPQHHQVGTCKMGPASDPMAVVDHRLRVHGIKGLRVADASIMPEITSGNTAAPTMMIGERAAHFIKKDWSSNYHRTE